MLGNRLHHFLSINILVQVTSLTEWSGTITKVLSNGEKKQENMMTDMIISHENTRSG